MAFTGLGGHAFSFKPSAVDRLKWKITRHKEIKTFLINYILPNLPGKVEVDDLQHYCWVLGCEGEWLSKYLDGEIVDGKPSKDMIKDMKALSERVYGELDEGK